MNIEAHFPAKTCPDVHFAGIPCATCEDVGRIHEGQCRCGEVILLDPGLVRPSLRFFYPGGFGRQEDGWMLHEVSCRRCGEVITRHWKATATNALVG